MKKITPRPLKEGVCQQMADLIHQITNKQYKLIKEDTVKELQNLCNGNDDYIRRVYTLLQDNLKKRHSEIRYNTFYIMNIFFKNYHSFRLLTVEDLKIILDLTAEINYESRLPPPKNAADELKKLTLKSIKEWVQMFGTKYKKLNLCYDFLKLKKKVDFEKLEMEDQALRKRKEEEQRRKRMLNEERLKVLRSTINETVPEINDVKESITSCLKLLIPTPEHFFINEEADDVVNNVTLPAEISKTPANDAEDLVTQEVDENQAVYRESGMVRGTFSINISLPKEQKKISIKETEENAIIIENAKDHYKLLKNKYLNTVKNWIKNLTTLATGTSELKSIIDLKTDIEHLIKKYENLVFEKEHPIDDGDSDSEMIEVTAELPSADETIIANLKEIECIPSTSGLNLSAQSTSRETDQRESTSEENERKKKLLQIAPKVPFDVDLYHWEEENLSAPVLLPVTAEGRHFWSATVMDDTDGCIPDPEGVAGLRTRVIEFSGKFEPVKWSCRFPLPNGKLCPRKDRHKCPFHGLIVARDETGKCINAEDEKKQKERLENANYSDAQNPELLAEIQQATGIDLKLPDRKKRKKPDDGGLTDIKKKENTVYKRLEKKIFNRSSVKKVARTLDNLDRRRFRDKFGDQFQYVHDTT